MFEPGHGLILTPRAPVSVPSRGSAGELYPSGLEINLPVFDLQGGLYALVVLPDRSQNK